MTVLGHHQKTEKRDIEQNLYFDWLKNREDLPILRKDFIVTHNVAQTTCGVRDAFSR